MNAVALSRTLPILVALAVGSVPALAQMWPAPAGTPPAGSPSGAPMGAAPGGAWPGNAPPCIAEFTRLRDVVQKTGLAAKAGHDKNASREEMCKLIEAFSAAEDKWVKYTETNAAGCGIPADAVKQIKANHEHSLLIRKQVCAAGPAPGAVAPTLSDALGTNAPSIEAKKSKSSFETLTGNPLTR
ncbi:MAG: hypothetical protein J2P54_17725 [Bradyrhizobiaceae bacterium]|nr:hypothetical protein [Bradyrhizobiaceae bacterium]